MARKFENPHGAARWGQARSQLVVHDYCSNFNRIASGVSELCVHQFVWLRYSWGLSPSVGTGAPSVGRLGFYSRLGFSNGGREGRCKSVERCFTEN